MHLAADTAPICTTGATECRRLLVACPPVRVLFLCAKHLFFLTEATGCAFQRADGASGAGLNGATTGKPSLSSSDLGPVPQRGLVFETSRWPQKNGGPLSQPAVSASVASIG